MLKDVFPEDEYEKIRIKEEADRKMLAMEFVIALVAVLVLLAAIALAAYIPMSVILKVCLLIVGFVVFGSSMVIAMLIEQKAGYFECPKCGHKHVPSFAKFLFSINMGRTRYFKCPECKKRSWMRKVISKD